MQTRRDELRQSESHDPTKPLRKLTDPTVCPECGATYIEGRWTWRHGPVEARRELCSACQRTRDDYPAGFITVSGPFASAHRDEILRMIRNTESREKESHPIKRIIAIDERGDEINITTTDIRLAQSIGKALESAFKGRLEIDFEEDIVRVSWNRNS